jgi:hypothetical protein
MDKNPLLRKCLIVGIILLFIGLAGIPSINANNPMSDHIASATYKSNITLNNGTLSGHVADFEENPIEGARVRVYFHDTYSENYSDSTGYFHVTNISICNCTKNATCSKEGYYPVWVYLGIWDNTTYDFVLTPSNMTELAITSLSPFTIKNVGNSAAFNVYWSIIVTVKRGFIFIGKSASGVVLGSLEPGQEIIVGSIGFLLGFGNIEITWTAWADNAPVVSIKITGRLVLFFILASMIKEK